jgi:hypothetical protein
LEEPAREMGSYMPLQSLLPGIMISLRFDPGAWWCPPKVPLDGRSVASFWHPDPLRLHTSLFFELLAPCKPRRMQRPSGGDGASHIPWENGLRRPPRSHPSLFLEVLAPCKPRRGSRSLLGRRSKRLLIFPGKNGLGEPLLSGIMIRTIAPIIVP